MPAEYENSCVRTITEREESPLLTPSYHSINSSKDVVGAGTTVNGPSPRRCVLNSCIMALGYLLAFSGFSALRNLESSINTLGEESLSIVGFSAVLGAYMSPLILYILGEKGSVLGMWASMSCLVAANFYPVVYTLFPAGGLFGFMAGPGWTAQLSYTTNTAIKYAKLVGRNEEEMVEMSNGIFYFGYSCSQVIGNMISSLVLYSNITTSHNESQRLHCGVNFCPNPNGPTTTESEISQNTLYGLFGIFLAGPLLALIVSVIFLDPLKRFLDPGPPISDVLSTRSRARKWMSELTVPLKPYRELRMILLAPVLFFSGMEQIIMFSGFTEAFVSCAIGVEYVGYTMICWGVMSACASFTSGILSRCFGRFVLCTGSLFLALGLQVYLYLWNLTFSSPVIYFIISGVWGIMDGILQTQLSAFLGVVFKDNHIAAFANFRILSYLGFAVTYGSTAFICQITQIYATSGVIVVSLVSYITLELRIRCLKPLNNNSRSQTSYEVIQ